MPLLGKRVLILNGRHKDAEGTVVCEDREAVTIRAPDLYGVESWYGHWYERKVNLKVMEV